MLLYEDIKGRAAMTLPQFPCSLKPVLAENFINLKTERTHTLMMLRRKHLVKLMLM